MFSREHLHSAKPKPPAQHYNYYNRIIRLPLKNTAIYTHPNDPSEPCRK